MYLFENELQKIFKRYEVEKQLFITIYKCYINFIQIPK
jgi:hypothetical protein